MRAAIWLAMVAIVVGLNLLIGGRVWGIAFIVISGSLLVVRLVMVYAASQRRGVDLGKWPEHRIGPRSPAG